MYIKDSIRQYILMKVDSGSYRAGEKVPSENQLAIKFNCSRQSSRAALNQLVSDFVLEVKRGKGYFVSDNYSDNILKPFGISNSIDETKLKALDLSDEAISELGIDKNDKYVSFVKEFYSNGKLIAAQVTALNKERIIKVDLENMRLSITRELLRQGHQISESNFQAIFKDIDMLNNYKAQFDWDREPLVIKVKTYSNNYWIEKSIRIESRKHVNLIFHKKKY